MNINGYLIRFSFTIMVIFGGTFTIHFVKTGDVLIGQMLAVSVGVILLVASWTWRKWNENVAANAGE